MAPAQEQQVPNLLIQRYCIYIHTFMLQMTPYNQERHILGAFSPHADQIEEATTVKEVN